MSRGWGLSAILVGVWETVALATGRVPTVSAAVWALTARRPRAGRLLVGCWLAALARHLLRP